MVHPTPPIPPRLTYPHLIPHPPTLSRPTPRHPTPYLFPCSSPDASEFFTVLSGSLPGECNLETDIVQQSFTALQDRLEPLSSRGVHSYGRRTQPAAGVRWHQRGVLDAPQVE